MKKYFCLCIICIFNFSSFSQNLIPLGTGLRVSGEVYCIEFDSLTNRTFIGGYFSQVNEMPASNIAWHDAQGWHAFGTGTDGYIAALKFVNGKLFAGGNFTQINGTPLNSVGYWDGSTWQSMAGGLSSGGIIRSMEWYDSSLYVSGYFVNADNQTANNIARWDGQNWHSVGSGSNRYYVFLSILDDSLYAYGNFTIFNGNIASVVKYDGTNWQVVLSDTLNVPSSIAINRDTLFCISYQPLNGITNLLYLDSGQWKIYISNLYYLSYSFLRSFHDTLFMNSSKYGINGDTLQICKINDSRQLVVSAASLAGQSTYYYHYSMKAYGNILYVTGFFNNLIDSFASGVIKYDGSGWSAPFFVSKPRYDSWYYGYGRCMIKDSISNSLIVSGKFYFAGDTISPNAAQWDGNKWNAMGKGLIGTDDSYAGRLLYFKDTLYACGTFTRSGNTMLQGIAKWNGSDWLDVNGSANGGIRSMAVYQDTLYVVGDFDTIGNIAAKYIAKYDGSNWWPVSGVHTSSSTDYVALCAAYGNLYLAGNYFYVGTTSNVRLASYNGVAWSVESPLNSIRTLQLLNDTVYATVSTSSVVYKYNGTSFSSAGYPGITNSYAYPSLLHNHLLIGDWNENQTFVENNGDYPALISRTVLYSLDIDSTSAYVTGVIPESYPAGHVINNIAKLVTQIPSASITFYPDTICDHQYEFFSAASSDFIQQYEWNFPGGTPSQFTVQNPIVKYNNPGDYDVYYKVSNAYGSDSVFLPNAIHVTDCTILLLNETEETTLKVYPNPFISEINIVSGNENIQSVHLTDLSGKIIFNLSYAESFLSAEEKISMDKILPGIYLLSISTSRGTQLYKIVKL